MLVHVWLLQTCRAGSQAAGCSGKKDIRDLSGDMLVGTLVGVVDKTNFWRRPESEHWETLSFSEH